MQGRNVNVKARRDRCSREREQQVQEQEGPPPRTRVAGEHRQKQNEARRVCRGQITQGMLAIAEVWVLSCI